MSVPAPPVAIGPGGCSAIFNNTLYTFTNNAFQSLPLEAGAKWQQLDTGVAVNGSRCVRGTQGNQDVLYIVGGTANSSQSTYQGLQRWGFTDRKWQTISFGQGAPSVLQDRINHGAAFLNDSASILVYSGYQGGSGGDSSQTFTIDTNSPTAVAQAFVSNKAPPGSKPMLLPWNSSHAVMAGGSDSNNQVWTFGLQDGWHQVKVLLPSSLGDMNAVQASLVQGGNGSKILELFDLSKSPNTVTGLLVDPGDDDGSPAPNDGAVPQKQVEFTNQPSYNSTFAPKATRSSYSIAESDDGLVVMVGGVTGDSDSVAIFNQTANKWLDAATFFNPTKASPSNPTTPPSAQTSTLSQSPAPADDTRMILGIVLGSIFGAIALTGLLFLLCLWTRRRHQGKDRRDSGTKNVPPRTVPMQATGVDPNAGVFANSPSPSRRYFSQRQLASPEERGYSPEPALRAIPPAATQNRPTGRSDQGWSQYFDGRTSEQESTSQVQETADTARLTAYTESSAYTSGHESAEVAPLHYQHDPDHLAVRDTFLDNSSTSHVGEDNWDPIRYSDGRSGYGLRPSSSIYGDNSSRGPHPGDRVVIPNFPNVPASRTASIVQPNDEHDRGVRSMTSNDLGNIPESAGLSSNPPSLLPARRTSGKVDDMSWLNLRQQ